MARDSVERASGLDVDAVIESFLRERSNSAHTSRTYRSELGRFCAWAAERELHPLACQTVDLNRYIQFINERDVADATKRQSWVAVSSLYDYAHRQWGIDNVPKHPDIEDAPGRTSDPYAAIAVIPTNDYIKFVRLALIEDVSHEALALGLVAVNALTVHEVSSANVEDVRAERSKRWLQIPSRGANARTPIIGSMAGILDEVVADRSTGPLLTNRKGNRMHQVNIWRAMRRVADSAEVDQVSAQLLRSTAGAVAAMGGASRSALAEMLGLSERSTARYLAYAGTDGRHGVELVWRRLRAEKPGDDLLDQADRLLDEPGVVALAPILLAGAALERHLRELCDLHGLTVDGTPSIVKYKGLLIREGKLSRAEGRAIDGWAEIRNLAAHGHDLSDATSAERFVDDVRHFASGSVT